jgi:hypothetical protein
VISEKSSNEGFQTVLKPRSLLRSRLIASPLGCHSLRAAPQGRARSCVLLLLTLVSGCVAGCQTYNANLGAPPTLSSSLTLLTPSAQRAGGSAFTLTVNGAGFVAGSVVQWNNSNRNTTVVSDAQLTADITAADIATPGTFQIRVMTPEPGASDGNNFSNILPFQVCGGACPQNTTATSRAISALPLADTYSPAISADRRYVAFASVSADPSANASTGLRRIYLRDTCEGAPSGCQPATNLVSAAWQGGEPNGDSRSPAISADGRFVAFASDANDLIENDSNGVSDIFLRDTCIGGPEGCTPATTRISVGSGGSESNGASDSPSLSSDGRFVAFDSEAQNLVPDGSSAPSGAFLRDTCHGAAGVCTPATTRLPISAAPQR